MDLKGAISLVFMYWFSILNYIHFLLCNWKLKLNSLNLGLIKIKYFPPLEYTLIRFDSQICTVEKNIWPECITELNEDGRDRERVSSDVFLEGGLGFQMKSFLFLSGSFSAQQKAINHLDKEGTDLRQFTIGIWMWIWMRFCMQWHFTPRLFWC